MMPPEVSGVSRSIYLFPYGERAEDKYMKKLLLFATVVSFAVSAAFAQGSQESKPAAPLKIGIPDDATNGARGIKLLETAGLITVDPAAGYTPELKDVTSYLYNIEIVPTQANTLTSTLDDFGAATINGTYATSYGLVPSRDALLIEKQDEGGNNPYVNVLVARTADKDNPAYAEIVKAYNSEVYAKYLLAKYHEAYFPSVTYTDEGKFDSATVVDFIDNYHSSKEGKTVVKIGVCGSSNDYLNAVQYQLDQNGANVYIERVEFDAYNLPNEALNAGDIDLNAFQHKAYLNNEIKANGYKIEPIADTLIAPLSLYSKKAKTLDELKTLAGRK